MKRIIVLVIVAVAGSFSHAATAIETESARGSFVITNTSSGSTTQQLWQTFTVPLTGDSVFDKAFLSFRTTQGRAFTFHLGAVSGTSITSTLASENEVLIGSGAWERIELRPTCTWLNLRNLGERATQSCLGRHERLQFEHLLWRTILIDLEYNARTGAVVSPGGCRVSSRTCARIQRHALHGVVGMAALAAGR